GGKGANLGELAKAGFPVPEGFCVTTDAYREFVAASSEMDGLLDELDALDPEDVEGVRALGERIRTHLLELEIPASLKREITEAWRRAGEAHAYAVRSSATAEDLPTASFAGQQDTYLNVKGREELLQHIRKCRSEEHTSELQSRENLVCRLLLEKKKKRQRQVTQKMTRE